MISRLHYITQACKGRTHAQNAELACKGGVDWVQLRIKDLNEQDYKEQALRTQDVCVKYGAALIINDNPALAKNILADGVHLGKTDMHPKEAANLLGENYIIGTTTNTIEDILELDQRVDYIGLGPYRYTTTKDNLSPILGLIGFENILNLMIQSDVTIPVIAIGGIKVEDLSELKQTRIYGVAISSAINMAEDPVKAAAELMNTIHKLF